VAVWIRRSADQMFQILGQVGANGTTDERTILASARSFSTLSDRTRLSPVPERVRVVAVSTSGPLPTVLTGLGPQGITPAETSVLNNLQPDETVQNGQLLKIVLPGRTR
jgi:predicted Zn-dependent protease